MLGSRPAGCQQKRKGLPPTGGGQPKARRCDLNDRTITLKVGYNYLGNSRSIEHGLESAISRENLLGQFSISILRSCMIFFCSRYQICMYVACNYKLSIFIYSSPQPFLDLVNFLVHDSTVTLILSRLLKLIAWFVI